MSRHGHSRARHRLSPRHERWLYGSGLALACSGLGWLVSHYLLRVPGAFGDTPHPAEVWWLRLHGAAVLVFLVVFGALLPGHVTQSWRHRMNRRSGGVVIGAVGLLGLSGYGLYYLVDDRLRSWVSLAHWVVGLAAILSLVAHVIASRRRAERVRSLHSIRASAQGVSRLPADPISRRA